jgi:GNAT superfamily N-acetyltransferase
MSDLTVRTVITKKDRLDFIKMPWSIYQSDTHWVPPLIFDQMQFIDPKKGVFFEYGEAKLIMIMRDGKPVGRISAHINKRHEEVYNDSKGFFGFFECENNPATARALFREAEKYLKDKGKKSLEGPFSFSIYDEMGILVDGFDSDPYVMNMHNPEYYGKLIEGCGFKKSVDWYAFRAKAGKTDKELDPRYFKIRERVLKNPAINIYSLEGRNIDIEAEKVKEIFHKAWNRNWGHVNFTDKEWDRIKEAVKMMVIRKATFVVEYKGKPVGFALAVYDGNEAVKKMNGRLLPFGFLHLLRLKNTKRLRLMLLGVIEEYRNLGLETVLIMSVIENGIKMGISEAEESNIVETNTKMIESMKHLNAELYKTYRIYSKEI